MRVLHVTDRLSARGGADWHLLGVIGEQARDLDVHLAVGRDDGTAAAPCATTVVPDLAGVDGSCGERAVEALAALASRLRPDVVHVHNCLVPAVLAWAADVGAVMTVQDHRTFCPGRGKLTRDGRLCREPMEPATCRPCFSDLAYFERIEATTRARLDAVRGIDRLVVLSRYMRDELVAAGLDGAKISVIPPFVHGLDADAEPAGPPCVLFVGRLVEAKGVFDALDVHRRAGIDEPLVFAGTGTARERLVAAGCEVLGWVPHAGLSGVYRRARALLMPSRWREPFGIVGIEALTMGVPVVAWDSGGVAEWAGCVTPWGDVDALAVALRGALGRPAAPPRGFEPAALMDRLRRLYERDRARVK